MKPLSFWETVGACIVAGIISGVVVSAVSVAVTGMVKS